MSQKGLNILKGDFQATGGKVIKERNFFLLEFVWDVSGKWRLGVQKFPDHSTTHQRSNNH